jgi:hypothetical protein
MKKGKVLSLFILSIFAISIISNFVSAETAQENFMQKFQELITGNWSGWSGFVTQVLSPQILFGILIFLIIFAVLDQISLFNRTGIKITVAIIVSFLAAGYISVDFIKPLLNQYTALGVTITLLFPLVLIFYFLKQVAPYNQLVQRVVWITFGVIVIFNIAINWDQADSNFTKSLYWVIIIASVVMMFFSKQIYQLMFKEDIKEAFDQYEEIATLIEAKRKADAQEALDTIGTQLPADRRRILQAEINKLKNA